MALTEKDSKVISFRIEKDIWNKFIKKCHNESTDPLDHLRDDINEFLDEEGNLSFDLIDYRADYKNKVIKFVGTDTFKNKSEVLATFPFSMLDILIGETARQTYHLTQIKETLYKKKIKLPTQAVTIHQHDLRK